MKPYLREKTKFSYNDVPENTSFEAGYLVTENSGWRSIRPVADNEKCVGCMQCYLYCPDGTISVEDNRVTIDYKFCKGCGICSKICKIGAIRMEAEK
ncbi:MAG: 4Fe-4S binding protein [Ruminococcus sp.]